MPKRSILIADDFPIARRGLYKLLEDQPDWKVVGEAADGFDAFDKAVALNPDLVILDDFMPRLGGVQAAVLIRRVLPQTRLLILATHDDRVLINLVVNASIDGFVFRSDPETKFLTALRKVLSGDRFPTPTKPRLPYWPITASGLTIRERQILQLLAEGLCSREVAGALRLSLRTVENHRARMMRRLEIRSFAELIRHGIRHGVVRV
jgi:DNA-binding NarL/FixJ family response regulator